MRPIRPKEVAWDLVAIAQLEDMATTKVFHAIAQPILLQGKSLEPELDPALLWKGLEDVEAAKDIT